MKVLPRDETIPFYQVYGYATEEFNHIEVKDVMFSPRLYNRLKNARVVTIADLLKLKYEDLECIPGFGKGCFNELFDYFTSLKKPQNQHYEGLSDHSITDELLAYRANIINKDFSFVGNTQLSEVSKKLIEMYKEGYELIDPDLISCCVNGEKTIKGIINVMSDYIVAIERSKKIKAKIRHRLNRKVLYFIRAFSSDEAIRSELEALADPANMTLDTYITNNNFNIDYKHSTLKRFLDWCDFDIEKEVKAFFDDLFKDERIHTIIRLRAERKTLEQVGNELQITRERVRQIEAKAIKKFQIWQNSHRVLIKIYAERDGDIILKPEELLDYFRTYYIEIMYFMQMSQLSDVTYNKQLGVFIIGDDSLSDKVQTYVEELPDTFIEKKAIEFIKLASEERDLPCEMVERAIKENFNKTGITYHRAKLTLTSMYENILLKYYTEGMHIYNDKDMDDFRGLLVREYGSIKLPENNRAIVARIADVGILCGRGRYKSKRKDYISKELAEKIHNYIKNSDSPIFLTNTIFNVFKEELIAEEVDNKYYLQGILKELYGNEFIFRRDYISKDESITSIYNEIIKFIKEYPYSVSKESIYEAFPGITEIVISTAVTDPDILNLFGEYLHCNRLKLTDFDIKYLKQVTERFVTNGRVCHCKDIFDFINNDNPTVLSKNGIFQSFSIFSLLECIFKDEFNFYRPYIAEENIKIDKAIDILKDMLANSTTMSIAEISSFAKESHLQLNSILEFINSCNETHLLINDKEIATIEYIGVNSDIGKYVEEQIKAEVTKVIAISQLTCIHKFTNLNVPWTEWLIYSILLKWSDGLEVMASSNHFRQSIPVVAPKGKMDSSVVESIHLNDTGVLGIVDDLSDIDELIEGYIIEELGEELNEL